MSGGFGHGEHRRKATVSAFHQCIPVRTRLGSKALRNPRLERRPQSLVHLPCGVDIRQLQLRQQQCIELWLDCTDRDVSPIAAQIAVLEG